MPIFGNIGLSLPGSGSAITSSFDVLPVYFSSVSYSREAATIGTLEAFVTSYDDTGSYGELSFRIPSKENRSTTGSKVLTIFATGSNNEPRVGIGFGENEKPIKAFDIKSQIDSAAGTEVLIRSSRPTIGGQDGDEAGSINFVIDTGSFIDVTTTGSAAKIKAIAKGVSAASGVNGMLQLDISRGTTVDINMMSMFYNDDGNATYPNFYVTTTSHSFEIQDTNPQLDPQRNASFIHSNGNVPYTIIRTDNPTTGNQGGLIQVNNRFGTGSIHLHGPTGEITASSFVGDGFEFEGQILKSTARSSAYGNNTYEGQIIKFGADILTANKAYVFTSIGWDGVNANSVSTTKGLFGIALGTNSAVDGLLTRGVHASSNWSGFSAGDTLYISLSVGSITNSTSSHTTGDSIRVIGYALGGNYIYLDPSPNYETL